MDNESDSSSYYETTYSQDIRIAKALEEEAKKLQAEDEEYEEWRRGIYEAFKEEEDNIIFSLSGVKFSKFNHLKIKFSFTPSDLSKFVSKKVMFKCYLEYMNGYWRVKRDSVPVNYKWRIYKLFYNGNSFGVTDRNLIETIKRILNILINWTKEEGEFRKRKHQRYLAGSDLELDTDDEELFLSDKEKQELFEKRKQIWLRMLPPQPKRLRRGKK